MSTLLPKDELLQFAADQPAPSANKPLRSWPVLVVDDDDEVHAATRYTLTGLTLLGRPLELVHALSASEARAILAQRQDFAVALLDVVMETEDAGLALVAHIRNTLALTEMRIILRTGQPGYAPELAVFTDYDINDYRTKDELTRTRLITALMAALRSYDQIRTIAENRRGLELIVRAVSCLMETHAISQFAEGVLTQLTALLKLSLDGIVCAQRGTPDGEDMQRLFVVGAAGRLARFIARPLDQLEDQQIRLAIENTMAQGQHQFDARHTTLFLGGADQDAAVYINTVQPLGNGDQQLLEVFAANITACFSNVRHVEQLNFAAYHDALTHLSNRSHFILQLDAATRQGMVDPVVMLLDIDHFADINDALGHDVGNALLVAVAARLDSRQLPDCTVARIGADVFGVLGPAGLLNAQGIFSLMARPFEVGEHLLPVTVTLGECPISRDDTGFVLLKRATIALNLAKRNLHGKHERFTREMEADTRWRQEVIRQLRHDFHAGKLVVWYQPQIDMASGRAVGVEALLRWPDGSGFVHPPTVFIPLAEYSGLIVEIGDWVMQQACLAYHQLIAIEGAPRRIAVNVSMPQFRAGGLTERIATLLGSLRVPANALELEITESIAMDEPKVVVSSLQALRALGVRIAIDDFGTGYSSLSQLKDLPIDCLKIDRAFISEIAAGRGGMFAETIIALGKRLGLTTIAEGVETAEQAGFLRALGCGEAQGFHYAEPMPLQDLLAWVQQR
ncbi:diguanylate cyclase (GGDEF) domain-containing protein [Andreprevotia lacus DSM 23236]|jgi:diguanylate cyclase (GGDEF)-like protein|uniref:Diguanylate cyclase (GGDEF) domain-containing protein n=1 Tax=Andreprevotia lacus DSM 23236 TaxID=1121001 RepID=A0A1W1XDP9_9NEIS|nr:EAL domain-containing protein [Andreprevotia lacus]SMC21778.1 diguanylate cyclase (GGDEF) domain-containing protein [Andreprevotia lacus DSM 23236]